MNIFLYNISYHHISKLLGIILVHFSIQLKTLKNLYINVILSHVEWHLFSFMI